MSKRKRQPQVRQATDDQMRPDWTKRCEVCEETPIVPLTGMCGPCTWGEAATYGGAWWNESADQDAEKK